MRVGAGGVGVPPVLDRTVTDPVSGVREDHPVVLVVGVPERGEVAVSEVIERSVFPREALAAIDGQFASLVANGGEGGLEAAPGSDLGKLVMITNQDHLRTHSVGSGDDLVKVDGAAHSGFVHHHNRVRIEVCVICEAWDGE